MKLTQEEPKFLLPRTNKTKYSQEPVVGKRIRKEHKSRRLREGKVEQVAWRIHRVPPSGLYTLKKKKSG